MRLAFISNKDPSIPLIDSDGGAVTVRNYAIELGKLGHTIDIYTPYVFDKSGRNSYLIAKSKAQEKAQENLSRGVTVYRKEISSANRTLLTKGDSKDLPGILDSYLFADSLSRINLRKYDALSIFHPLAGFGLVDREMVDLNRTILFPMLLSDYYMKYQHISQMYRELEANLIKSVRGVTSPSRDEANISMERGANQETTRVIHRGIDEKNFIPNPKKKAPNPYERIKISCTNAIRPQKGQHQLVLAASLLKQKGINVEINFAGESGNFYKLGHRDYYQSLKNLIEQNDLNENINFNGVLSPREVSVLLRSSDFAVFPSETESFGKSPLEAIVSGTPTILGSDVPAYEEFVRNGENALFVDRTPLDIADAIISLSNDEKRYLQMSNEGPKLTEKFSWKKVSRDLERFYKEVIEII